MNHTNRKLLGPVPRCKSRHLQPVLERVPDGWHTELFLPCRRCLISSRITEATSKGGCRLASIFEQKVTKPKKRWMLFTMCIVVSNGTPRFMFAEPPRQEFRNDLAPMLQNIYREIFLCPSFIRDLKTYADRENPSVILHGRPPERRRRWINGYLSLTLRASFP